MSTSPRESHERISAYLLQTGLDHLLKEIAIIEKAIQTFIGILGDLPPTFADDALYTYQVPKLSDDGTCSLIEEMADAPYDLSPILGGRTPENRRKLLLLNQLVEHATQMIGADWLGIYQSRSNALQDNVLVKLAYRGRPSRAEFPLTEAFATKSTNSTVGLSGKAKVIDDVAAFQESGGGFYVCDDAVQSEACLPLLDEAGRIVGIIDAEAAPKGFFNTDRLCVLAALALVTPVILP